MDPPDYGARRRRKTPPALTRPLGGSLLPFAVVLEEIPSPAGLLLWRLLQDVTLWMAMDSAGREGLFRDPEGAARSSIAAIQEELDTVDVLVRDPHPDAGPLLARMCDRIRLWAEGQGHRGTAVEFAQAAALADPTDAGYAYEVGRLARRHAESARAETWYRRGIVLARRIGDREAEARCYGGLANLLSQRGNYAAALEVTRRIASLSRRYRLRELWGIANHGLAVLRFETGEVREGMRHARTALRVFGPRHTRTSSLLHDMAIALMDQCGAFLAAREVLHALLPHLPGVEERLVASANLARAAGGTGVAALFEALWTETWVRAAAGAEEGCTDALIALARGAGSLGRWDPARQAASRALELAEERREGKSIYLAQAILAAVDARSAPDAPVTSWEGAATEVERFVQDLVGGLRGRPPVPDRLLQRIDEALRHPEDARKAYELGRALRVAAEYDKAEAWLGRGLELARRAGDREVEAMCLGGLGNLHAQRGNASLALEYHQRHREFAREHGLTGMEGLALLDLCATSFKLGDGEEGFAFAREALGALGVGHPCLPRLAHDVALYLLESRGDFANALLLLQALRAQEFPPEDRLLLEGSLARAAAGAGQAQLFEETASALWLAMEALPDPEVHPWALLHLAEGALLRGLTDLAAQAARRALAGARAREESQAALMAERVIEKALHAGNTRARLLPERHPTHDARMAGRLARGIAKALRERTARRGRTARSRPAGPGDSAPSA